ncbi:MAG: site-2 protease family protein [Deltaproteobacteria bacterium]|nr:site-2 protease family protein [Deltaproteobacteria bacterium]MBN2674145.1 site-2 protease family protein [Deltaproteobacteria bacterium]
MNMVYQVIIVLVPMILSLSVHEFAHAWSAYKLGDDTAKRQGRLTLNPLAHIDPIGTLLLPILLTVQGGGFFFGWAKPVPVNSTNFRRGISMRKGDILTAVAGPMSNIIIAFIASGIIIGTGTFGLASETNPAMILVSRMFMINLALAVFNILPVPPLDGHYLLPQELQSKLRQYQLFVFIALLVAINFFSTIMAVPITIIGKSMVSFWALIFGGA